MTRRTGGIARTREQRERLFAWVYENNQWGRSPVGDRYYSDSAPELTLPLREAIAAFIRSHDISRVVDLGCGDFVLARDVAMGNAHYVGVDIYDRLIEHNRARFGDARHEFVVADLIDDALPEGDLALVNMVLYLMSHADVLAVLDKLHRYEYVLITDGQPEIPASERRNVDKPTDKYTPRDWHGTGFWLELPPFELAVEPICEIRLPEGEIMRTVLLEHPPCASS